jgi:glycerol kinase
LTRGTTRRELARAALEAVCYQTHDLLAAMKKDWPGASQTTLRVDGGMTASDWTMQALADILDSPVDRPRVLETTALGAAYLAALQIGMAPEPAAYAQQWKRERQFRPAMPEPERRKKLAGWADAIRRLQA